MLTLATLESKATASTIGAALLLCLAAGVAIWINALTQQRNDARLEVQRLTLTVQGYQEAARQAQAAMDRHAASASAKRQETALLVDDLTKALPKTDEDARAWAIKAAGRIQ